MCIYYVYRKFIKRGRERSMVSLALVMRSGISINFTVYIVILITYNIYNLRGVLDIVYCLNYKYYINNKCLSY